MPNLKDRPYIGTWDFNNRAVVKHTPDMMIFVNGDTAIPGCPKCNGRIDIQRFVKQVSVEAGTDPGAHSGSATMVVPRSYGDQLFREGHALLQPALEVHIYMRGYFPTQGQFAHIPENSVDLGGSTINLEKMVAYPYYHVFHGVVTSVTYEYSDGFYTASMSFASLLHFWQYQNLVMNGQALGSKVKGSTNKPAFYGTHFTNMHPFAIIYQLYRDQIGAAAIQSYKSTGRAQNLGPDKGGKQVWSWALMYWENRFRTTLQELRIYGANGRLFNSVQQAYLAARNNGRIDGSPMDNPTHVSPGLLYKQNDVFRGLRDQANRLGLEGAGDDFVFGRLSPSGGTTDLNIMAVTAFSQAVSEMGSPGIEETSYSTKLDIAQQVCKSIDYEFYQDVDGDLVFKPPFYNLDTRGNRVFRIEDIDIISVSFQEKEPEVTYMSMQSANLKGYKDVGDGITGHAATFYDWPLIAKFGWRPASEDVTHFDNKKSLFYMCQARMAQLNRDVNSATLTIPIRPELRPGFPVYIRFIDAFYYVTALSHSFGFGTQCTTTLTLTARRAKFHAPGLIGPLQEGENAIGRIRLDRPDLPTRPLEVYEDGLPRYAGFPNVVMALDTAKLNPKFFMIPVGLESLGTIKDVDLLFNMVREQLKQVNNGAGIFSLAHAQDEGQDPTEHTEYRLQQSKNPEDDIVFSLSDLMRDFHTLDAARKEVASADRAIASKAADKRGAASPSKRSALEGEIASLQVNLESLGSSLTAGVDPERNKLVQLIIALQSSDTIRKTSLSMPDAPTSSAWLDLLSERKNAMHTAVSGHYRYYSASHPDPNQQGQSTVVWDEGSGSNVTETDATVASTDTLAAPEPTTPVSAKDVRQFGAGDLTDPKVLAEKRAAARKRGARRNKADHKKIADRMEQITGVDGLSTFLHSAAQVESSGFRSGSYAANRTDTERIASTRTFLGQEVASQQMVRGCNVAVRSTSASAKRFQEKYGRLPGVGEGAAGSGTRHKTNPHLYDSGGQVLPGACDRWGFGSGSYYGVFPSSGMGAFRSSTGSKYANLPPEAIFDPLIVQAMQYNYMATTCKEWSGKAVNGIMTWGEMRRSMAAPSTIGKGEFGTRKTDQRFIRSLQTSGEFSSDAEAIAFANTPVDCKALLDRSLGRIGKYDKLLDKLRDGKDLEVSPKEKPTPPPPPEVADPVAPSMSREIQRLPAPMPVLGFVSGPLPKPDGVTRSPEAQLGQIVCEQGLRILQPDRTKRVQPTSQIQQFSWSVSEARKKVEVMGFSTEQGDFSPKVFEKHLTKYLSNRFAVAAEQKTAELPADEITPRVMIEEVYNEIRDLLNTGAGSTADKIFADVATFDFDPGSRAYPVYGRVQGAFVVEGTEIVSLPSFEDVVTGLPAPLLINGETLADVSQTTTPVDFGGVTLQGVVEVTGATTAAEPILIDGTIADANLLTLQGMRRYTSRKKKTDKTQQAVINDYVKAVVDQVVKAYRTARASAGYTKGRKPKGYIDRMRPVVDAFNQISFDVTQVSTPIGKGKAKTTKGKSGKAHVDVMMPVIPISDGEGYEHFGSFRYGRGLTVEKGGSFDRISAENNPLAGLTAPSAEAFLQALTSVTKATQAKSAEGQALKQQLEAATQSLIMAQLEQEDFDTDPATDAAADDAIRLRADRLAKLKLVIAELAASNPDAVGELAASAGIDPDVLVQDATGEDVSLFAARFSNFPAILTTESNFSTTIVNAAYNLTDLSAHLTDEVNTSCICRGSDASVLLSAYGRSDFISLDGIDPKGDPATAWVSEGILSQLQDFQFQRQALRGQVLETGGSDLFQKFRKLKDMRNNFKNAGSQLRQLGSQFKRTAQSIGDIQLGGG